MRTPSRSDEGASLILAIVFVFAIGLILVALGGLAANAMLGTNNLTTLRTSEGDAESATVVATRYVQTTYSSAIFPGPVQCLPASFQIPSSSPSQAAAGGVNPFVVWCSGTATTGTYNRVVDFYACPTGTSSGNCTGNLGGSLFLHAQIGYNDTDFSGNFSCSTSSTATCGESLAILHWDVIRSDA